jgi:PTS system nitrogen regulatory IIA component
MDIGELLAEDGIVLRSGASSKRQALHVVAETAASGHGHARGRVHGRPAGA